jgi:hypothetical protein
MQWVSPDELVRMKPHRLPARRTVGAVVLPAERDAGVIGCNEVAVRDGDAVGAAGKIAQHLLGSRERRLAEDHPLAVSQRADEEALLRAPRHRKSDRHYEGQLLVRAK